ncbi:Protein asteroid 1 [Sparganum proliferum]
MGIPLLQTFLRNNPGNFTTYRLHRTKVVIDGPNISNTLYNEAGIFNQFNGEYLQYEALVEQFLLNMRKCEVEPIFVFDGLHEPAKYDTCLQRLSENLQRVAAFQESYATSGVPAENTERPDIKCLLISAVFVAVLKRLNMKFVFVDYEADHAVAELAIKLKCPLMSRDSDFFIFTNYWGECGGYCCIQPIPFNASPKSFANRVCEACASSGISRQACCYYLETSCFTPDRGAFSRLAAPLRPVFAVLWGNDYASAGYFDRHLPGSVTHAVNAYGRFDKLKKMANLISWLSNFGSNLQEPISYVLSRFPTTMRPEAEDKFFKGLSLYSVDLDGVSARYGKYTGLAITTDSGVNSSKAGGSVARNSYEERARQVLRGQGDTVSHELTQNWPLMLVDYFRTHPTFKLFDGVYSFGYLRGSDVEDVKQSESTYVCARPLRQLIYSALFQIEGAEPRGLRGIQGGGSKNPYVREILRNEHMRLAETAVNLLKVNLDTPQQMIQLHLGLPWERSGLPNSLHALAYACFIVLNSARRRQQRTGEQRTTVASCPMVVAALAVSVAAFVLHQQETLQHTTTGEVLADRIRQQLSLMNPMDSAQSSLNFPYMHIYSQLQIVYVTLVTLGAVITAIMPSEEGDAELGSTDMASFCFPSGRLAHRLAVRLSHLSQSERGKEICEVIFPQLMGRNSAGGGTSRSLSQTALSQMTSYYTKATRFVDALLESQR